MDNNLDELQQSYKNAMEQWIASIRAEEALAGADHSEIEMERWDRAGLAQEAAAGKARKARDDYKDALRHMHYGI
jgi:hypothetical protein